jgi:aminoglycoside 2'-N-acetyltransferase I
VGVARLSVRRTEDLDPLLRSVVRALLDDAFGGEFAEDDWQHALGGWHVLVHQARELVAHAAVVPRQIEVGDQTWLAGYVEAVATAPARQGEGHGTAAMRRVGEVLREEFDLGVLSTGAHHFYERLAWERWQGPAHVRTASGVVRTPDEDDGIMVLRFGPSAAIDLRSPITCEERPGDDW